MKRFLFFLLLFFFQLHLFPNAAQPGIFGLGGAGTFSLLYPEDSGAYKKIQMVKELVTVQLYKGFAVVKGEYWMYNTSKDTINIHTGYPLNSVFNTNRTSYILFNGLHQMEVKTNGYATEIIKSPVTNSKSHKADNWYVWKNKFNPADTTKIEVYFIVNTNEAFRTHGYRSKKVNGFAYILDSGSSWKQPIIKGCVTIQLMNQLSLKDIKEARPSSIFTYNKENKILKYEFSNLSPTPDNNIRLAYSRKIKKYNIENILANKNEYYQSIDKLSTAALPDPSFEPVKLKGYF